MGQLFAWSLVSSLPLICMYLVYRWMLAGENQHSFNRGILLMIYAVSLASPLLLVDFSASVRGDAGIANAVAGIAATPVETAVPVTRPWLPDLFLIIYLVGIAGVLFSTVVVICRLMQIIGNGERLILPGGKILVLTSDSNIAPFSWRRYVVMSRTDWDDAGEVIVLHEMYHLSARHWVDLLIAQAIVALLWYNPVAWLMREDLKTVHEYQADQAVMMSGSDIHEYQMLLIKKAVGARFPSLANSLNHSQLKKRVTMMYKKRSSAGRRLCSLALVPACAVALIIACTSASKSVIDDASRASVAITVSKGSEKNPQIITLRSSEADSVAKVDVIADMKIYIDGELQDAEALKQLKNSDIASVTVDRRKGATYIVTKQNATQEGMSVYIDGELKSSAIIADIDSCAIESVTVDKPRNTIYITTKKTARKSVK